MCSEPRAGDSVVVGLSGGVDSAVAAARLVEQGFAVHAVFMVNWDQDDDMCTARQDYRDAQAVAQQLGITLSRVNLAETYWDHVFSHFLSELRAGRTPNPDVLCNREVKFRAFLDHAQQQHDAQWIATGHYARASRSGKDTQLWRAEDHNKDQTYFLHSITQNALDRSLFPLGDMLKPQVRALAQRLGLHNHAKRDSTGICFIGEGRFRDFVARYLPYHSGDILDTEGHVIGEHQGLMFYTLGQRKGLGIGGQRDSSGAPWFVLDKDLSNNALIVTQDESTLLSRRVRTEPGHWFDAPQAGESLLARIRHRGALEACTVTAINKHWQVDFAEPVRAATPGQYLTLYRDQRCIGGAAISGHCA